MSSKGYTEFSKDDKPLCHIGQHAIIDIKNGDGTGTAKPASETQTDLDLGTAGDFKFLNWGGGNNEPQRLDKLIKENVVLSTSLRRLHKILGGLGIIPVRVKGVNPDQSEILEFINDKELINLLNSGWCHRFVADFGRDYVKYGNAFAEFRPNAAGDRINKLTTGNAFFARLGEPGTDGFSKSVIYCGRFPDSGEGAENYILLGIDPEDDISNLKSKGILKKLFFYHSKDPFSNQPYYAEASWQSVEKSWLPISNKIPIFINASMDNELKLTTLIEIPQSYIDAKFPEEEYPDPKVRREKIDAHLSMIDQKFTDVKDASNTLITLFNDNEGLPEAHRWKINVIKREGNRNKILEVTTADSYVAMAVGINPDVLGLVFGNSKGGSMQRELFLIDDILSAMDRQQILEPLRLMILYNFGDKYADIQLRFKRQFITPLDTGKSKDNTIE